MIKQSQQITAGNIFQAQQVPVTLPLNSARTWFPVNQGWMGFLVCVSEQGCRHAVALVLATLYSTGNDPELKYCNYGPS